jgi:hypothetical protein
MRLIATSEEKLPECHATFDDADHRFNGRFSQAINGASVLCFQAVLQSLECANIGAGWLRFVPMAQSPVVPIALDGDIGSKTGKLASVDVQFAKIPGIREQTIRFADWKFTELFKHRFEERPIGGTLAEVLSNDQEGVAVRRHLGIVSLNKTFGAGHDPRLVISQIDLCLGELALAAFVVDG